MQPLLVGTTLRHRYHIIQVLGQGGFGRTYLAEDQNRFREHCVLKELVPAQTEATFLEKAKDLFQQEAKTLYGIQHPQVPEFRELFEQNQRFFLVQQYIPGKTCWQLLQERKAQGSVFQESEIRQLLVQTLSVLVYLHDRNIIHRDISPDNIILQSPDGLPVLIDFGAVKSLVSRMNPAVSTRTIIGKPLYAPVEQMQTGMVYPSSDLYALAVTCIVLLTGQQPEALYDPKRQTWHWQKQVTIKPDLATVLNRMLQGRASDRYPSARAAISDLQGTIGHSRTATVQSPTLAVGRNQPRSATTVALDWSTWDHLAQRLGQFSLGCLKLSFWLLKKSTQITGIVLWKVSQWSMKVIIGCIKLIYRLTPKWLLLSLAIATAIWTYQKVSGQILLPPIDPSPGGSSAQQVWLVK